MRKTIGRKEEISLLSDALESNRSELIAIYGRRRVGKTFLVQKAYKNNIIFEFSGMHKAPLKKQLKNFYLKLKEKDNSLKRPTDWLEAFYHLEKYIATLKLKKKKVIFIDEFPWLDTARSGFLSAFDNFWNSFASKRDDLVIVICGSAASYMIQNIIKSTGGLHNRITNKIQLLPFNLLETKQLLSYNKVKLSQYDILQIYMAIGGVPHYLEKITAGESVAQAIDRLCFKKDGFLRTEFQNIFNSLFTHHYNHEAVIRTLASVRKGLTRTEIGLKSKVKSGGTLTKTLSELEESGFIEKYLPYKGTKDSLFRLTDEYSLFYIKFIEKTKPSNSNVWNNMQAKQSYKIWSGFSFETVCIKHVEQIKAALKISGVNSLSGSWIDKNKTGGAQIDLLIDRDDNVINICEIKFHKAKFKISKKYAAELTEKIQVFTDVTKTKKNIFLTFITSYGLYNNIYSKQLVQNELTIDALFIG